MGLGLLPALCLGGQEAGFNQIVLIISFGVVVGSFDEIFVN